jgi:HSP20 family protein
MTAINIWRPFREVTSLQEHVNQLFRDVFSDDVFPKMDSLEESLLATTSLTPKTDVYEEDDKILLEMEAPGLREEDINLTIEGNTLTISGERKQNEERKKGRYQRFERYYGSFSRTFTLPATVDPNSIRAEYEHGVLHVSMSKKAEARPRRIKVNDHMKQLTG